MRSVLLELIDELHPELPLRLEGVNWDGFRLGLEGTGWAFHTMSPWRLVSAERLIRGSEEAKNDDLVLQTLQADLIEQIVSGGSPHLDPVFVFQSGLRLQIFSIHSLEPWTFVTPKGRFYASQPAG